MNINLNKRSKSTIAIYAIIFIAVALLYLVIPFHKNAASWISFSFTLISVIVSLAVCIYAFKDADTLVSKVYGFPVFRIGYIYSIIQIIVCIVICTAAAFVNVPAWIAVITSVLLLAAASIGVIAVDNVRDVAEKMDVDTRDSVKKVTMFRISMDGLADRCSNPDAAKAVEKLAESFRYSDPVSSPETTDIETKIKEEISGLEEDIMNDDANAIKARVTKLSNILSERNRICKASKR